MSEAIRRMTLDEFDDWQPLQDVWCELVDGLVFAITGATFAHDIVVGNLFFELTRRLREVEYRAIPSLQTILILAPDQIEIGIWRRAPDDSWTFEAITDDQAANVNLAPFDVSIPVADLYAGAETHHTGRPRLVWDVAPER